MYSNDLCWCYRIYDYVYYLSEQYDGFSLSESNDMEDFSIFLVNMINEQFTTQSNSMNILSAFVKNKYKCI